jgi:glycosyltransferase involved in cell wall biosynthesis
MNFLQPEVIAGSTRTEPRGPLITFVVAVFNAKQTLGQCLDSVTQQSSKNYELIVIDGASTDGSVDLLRSQSNHFAYWATEPDRGVYDAWNKALVRARGEWICFLGADDYLWNNDVVEQLSAKLVALPIQTSIAYGKIMLLDRDDNPMFELGEPWYKLETQFKKKMCLPHPAVFHRRSLFEAFGGFDTAFRIAGDYEFLLRCMKGQTPHFLDDLVVSAMRPGGLSSNPSNTIRGLKEAYRAQQKNGQKVLLLPRLMAWARVYTRLIIMKFLGIRATLVLLDWGRNLMGLPAYWTKV